MSVINTNITGLLAQSNLSKTQSSLSTALERLSSGLRINSFKDDAAGGAIANRFTAQINGLSQARRNANDGISLAQTTEGALNQVNDNLQRIRELTVQAKNGTNSSADLRSIQDEIALRLEEIDRVSSQTEFNGTTVLAKDKGFSIQVGANDGETITVNLQEITSSTLSLDGFSIAGPQGATANAVAADFQEFYGDDTAITVSAVTDRAADLAANLGIAAGSIDFGGPGDELLVDENGNTFVQVDITAADGGEVAALRAQGLEVEQGVTATFFVAADPADATFAGNTATFDLGADLNADALVNGSTNDPLSAVDDALAQVDSFRSELGAVQNRLISATQSLQANETNLASARSRIQDADLAVEVAALTRAQILQQAGTSVLAQANQLPQSVLGLLG